MNKTFTKYHTPVLLHESIDGLKIKQDGVYIDLTFGGGGHSREILKKLNKGHLFAFDQDLDVHNQLFENNRFTFIHSNYRYAGNFLNYLNIGKVDGVLADLGVSTFQLNSLNRGFSFQKNGDLDMRMNKSKDNSAQFIINNYSRQKLEHIFKTYGEVNNAAQLATRIEKARVTEKIKSSTQFVDLIENFIPKRFRNKYLAKVYQALRIEVNDELDALKSMLNHVSGWLKIRGRLVIISYHSLEDRLVKEFIRTGNTEGQLHKDIKGNVIKPFEGINRKVMKPTFEEIQKNKRARSARLRIAEKIV